MQAVCVCVVGMGSKAFKSGNGPKSWNNAKKRLKRPETAEMKASMAQEVGKAFTKKRADVVSVPRPKAQMKRKLAGDEKRLRTLNKLLRQIEELQVVVVAVVEVSSSSK